MPNTREVRDIEALTPRELSVTALIAEARTNYEISKRLGLTEGSVKTYLGIVFKKLGVTSRTAVALWYWRQYGLPK